MPPSARHPGGRRGFSNLAAAAVALDYVEEVVLDTARDVHGAVAARVHGLAAAGSGGVSRGIETVHDGIAAAVYGSLALGARGAASALREADRRGVGAPLDSSPRGRFVNAALHGIVGDRLVERHPEVALRMGLRLGGHDVDLDPDGIAAAFPGASRDLVVFLHGLSESEAYWDRRREETGGSYGDRLAADLGFTPLFVRANTGLSIAENGVALAGLLDDVVAGWPVPIRRIVLVGHSMGGLVMRAACAVSTASEEPWNLLVSDVVTLGTPHLGAPIARGLHHGSRLLSLLPELAAFGRLLDHRSVGIGDLRRPLPPDVENLPHARYRLVAATLTASPRHPVGETLGDLLVRYPSAVGRPRRGVALFPDADELHVPGADHFDLLNHPDVYAALRRWLSEPVTTSLAGGPSAVGEQQGTNRGTVPGTG